MQAQQLSGLVLEMTGVLGRRTRWQAFDTPQLVLKAKSDAGKAAYNVEGCVGCACRYRVIACAFLKTFVPSFSRGLFLQLPPVYGQMRLSARFTLILSPCEP